MTDLSNPVCARCGGVAEVRSYCRPCKRLIGREWRKANRRHMTPEQRLKANARGVSKMAVRRGSLKRQPCEACGEKAEMHHPDYSQPLLVRWLCPLHHRQVHAADVPGPRMRKPPSVPGQRVQSEKERSLAVQRLMKHFAIFAPIDVPRGTQGDAPCSPDS